MPENDAAYTIPAIGRVYRAPAGTPAPTSATLNAPPDPWVEVGHVGTEDNTGAPQVQFDGGDKTVKGSWAKKAIRTITAAITDYVTMSLSQIDRDSLGWYFGGTGGTTAGEFAVNTTDPNSTESALLIVWQDGTEYFGIWYSRTEIGRDDSIDLTDAENPVMLPIRATILDPTTGTLKFKFVAATIAAPPSGFAPASQTTATSAA